MSKEGLMRKSIEVFIICKKYIKFMDDLDESHKNKSGMCWIFSIEYWIPYFNFTTSQITSRLKASLIHTPPFKEVFKKRPDLYSTIWIYNTIIFLIGIANYFS